MDNDQLKGFTPPPFPGRGGEICPATQAWTCTIQCAGGSRTPVERVFNTPGVEVCTVSQCSCQPLPPALGTDMPASSVFEVAVPLAFVIFGGELMMRGPFK